MILEGSSGSQWAAVREQRAKSKGQRARAKGVAERRGGVQGQRILGGSNEWGVGSTEERTNGGGRDRINRAEGTAGQRMVGGL